MKRMKHGWIICLLISSMICFATTAIGEITYYTIKDICDTMPERWQGEYTDPKGNTISIDVPIVVPEVDTVPIVRIKWGGPYKNLESTLQVKENSRDLLFISHDWPNTLPNDSIIEQGAELNADISWEDASTLLLEQLRSYIPVLKERDIECFNVYARADAQLESSWYCCNYFQCFHGIPYIIDASFWKSVESERGSRTKENEPTVPSASIYGSIINANQFSAVICAPEEIGVEATDVPLLSFDAIKKAFEHQVAEGYVYSLDEVRFGYMLFLDPNMKGEEFILQPVWAARGRTTPDPSIPFDLKTEQYILNYSGYNDASIIVVNAQTGKVYDFSGDLNENRRYGNNAITWDAVQKNSN